MSGKEGNKESEVPDYDEDEDQLEEEQEKKTGETEQETTNKVLQRCKSILTGRQKGPLCNVIIAKRLNQK